MYCAGRWDEEATMYIGKLDGNLVWTEFLSDAVVVDSPQAFPLPWGVMWLPVFVPDIQ